MQGISFTTSTDTQNNYLNISHNNDKEGFLFYANFKTIKGACKYRDVSPLHPSISMLIFSATVPNLENTPIPISKCSTLLSGNRTQREAPSPHPSMCFPVLSNQGLLQVFHKSKCRRGWFKISGRCYPTLGSDPTLKKPHLRKKKKPNNCPTEINGKKALNFCRWNTLLRPILIARLLAQGSLSLASSKRKTCFKVCFAWTGIDNNLSHIHAFFPLVALAEKGEEKSFESTEYKIPLLPRNYYIKLTTWWFERALWKHPFAICHWFIFFFSPFFPVSAGRAAAVLSWKQNHFT